MLVMLITILTLDPIVEEGNVIFKFRIEYKHKSEVDVGANNVHVELLRVIVGGNVIMSTLDGSREDLCLIVNV